MWAPSLVSQVCVGRRSRMQRMSATGAGLGGSLSTAHLVSAFMYYPIFPFHACGLDD